MERLAAIETAQAEMNCTVAETIVTEALKISIPPAADQIYEKAEHDLVCLERK